MKINEKEDEETDVFEAEAFDEIPGIYSYLALTLKNAGFTSMTKI